VRLTFALTIAASSAASASVARAQVAMFRGGASHAGEYRTRGVAAFGGLQWRVQTGGPVRSSPVLSESTIYIGSGDGSVYAIDATTGTIRWRHATGGAVASTPAVGGGLVFVNGNDGRFRALSAADGSLAWSVATGAAIPLKWGYESGEIYTSSPALDGATVVFGSQDGHVYALDARTGRQRWRYRTGGRVYASPAIAAGTVIAADQAGSVFAISLTSGRQIWRFDTEGTRLRSADWGFDRTTVQSSPAVVGGAVYVGARDGFLYAIDRATGAERWRNDHKVSWVNSSPAVSQGLVYAGSSDGRFVHAVDTATGQERWRAKAQGTVWASPAVDDALLYVGEGDGTMYALDKRTGQEAWRYRVGHRLFSSPLVDDGRLYFGSDDGGIYAVNAARAEPLRRAVFFDSAAVASAIVSSEPLRAYLGRRGYEVLDTASLARFMIDRVRDRAPSVVVFAMDYLPRSVAPVAADTVLFRRYLAARGKVVWLGTPPLLWPQPDSGRRTLKGVDRGATARLLGVRHERGNFDLIGVSKVTSQAKHLGLPDWWLDNWGANPEDVTHVLAEDEWGLAAAWVKRFGGPSGSGFVRLFAGDGSPGRPWSLIAIQTAAELWPVEGAPSATGARGARGKGSSP
jgi:outer membrane protein assembly factor BamB